MFEKCTEHTLGTFGCNLYSSRVYKINTCTTYDTASDRSRNAGKVFLFIILTSRYIEMFSIKFPVKLIPWQVLFITFFLICMSCSYSQASAEEHRGDLLVSKMISLNPPDGIVHKRTFSDQSRILFVAGLEGTGHHGVQAMIKVCVQTSEKLCEAIEDVTHVFQEARGKSDTIFGLLELKRLDIMLYTLWLLI